MEEHHTSAQANPASTREDKDNWESSHGTKEGQTEVENSIIIGAENETSLFKWKKVRHHHPLLLHP